LSSFIVTPFSPSGKILPNPHPTDSGVIIDTMTLIEAMQSMANYFVALHSATGIAFNELRTITSGFNTSGTELTVTKLNGF